LPESTISMMQIDGAAVIGSFVDYDSLIAQLRARISAVGLSYAALEEITGMAEGAAGKYLADARVKHLSVDSLLKISEAVGIRMLVVTDERLLRKYRPLYEQRETRKIHARGRAKLGAVTMKRVRPIVLSELGRRGAAARNAKLGPEVRRELARAAARARWARRSGQRG
jgi:transcriptional regulator with XRE-family HTH domain